jgi:hypothetical protein
MSSRVSVCICFVIKDQGGVECSTFQSPIAKKYLDSRKYIITGYSKMVCCTDDGKVIYHDFKVKLVGGHFCNCGWRYMRDNPLCCDLCDCDCHEPWWY